MRSMRDRIEESTMRDPWEGSQEKEEWSREAEAAGRAGEMLR